MPSASVALSILILGAAGPLSAQRLELRGVGGWGFDDLYSGAAGANATVTVPVGVRQITLGAFLLYHFGEQLEQQFPSQPTVEIETRPLFYGAEVGITWLTAPLIVRGVGSVGAATVSTEVSSEGSEDSESTTRFAFGPGLVLALPIGRGYAGVEAKYWGVEGNFPNKLALYGTVGIRLR